MRRMLAERGLARTVDVVASGGKARMRWQAERPGALWHGDVCHGPTLTLDGRRVPSRVHGLRWLSGTGNWASAVLVPPIVAAACGLLATRLWYTSLRSCQSTGN